METDTPQQFASATKPSYVAAVKKNVAKKNKTSKKGNTPSAHCGPKLSPKKPVESPPPTKPSPAIVKEVADYDASEITCCAKIEVMGTLCQLMPLMQNIN
ncbi:hypothetical protein Trydic_g8415 [Trypoxylus dichotomus]